MRCVYKEASCPSIPADTVCFRCENCSKQLVVATPIASRINQITQSFPDCPATPGGVLRPMSPSLTANPAAAQPALPAPPPAPQGPPPPPYVWDPAGAGTQLKKLLAKVGITSTENCSCNARARAMNEKGVEWCEQNVPEIVSWLKEEAGRRKLPFLSLPAKIVVQRAIKIAKKIRANQPVEAADEEIPLEESSSAA